MSMRKWLMLIVVYHYCGLMGEYVMKNKDKLTKMKKFQGLNWTPKAIPGNRIIESKKIKSRQQYKTECRHLTAAYESQDYWC